MLRDIGGDIRYALRRLRRSPIFTGVATFTLAVGIAAVTTIFSFVNAVYFRPLPYPDAARIAAIGEERRGGFRPFSVVSPVSVAELLRPNAAFDRVAVFRTASPTILFDAGADQLALIAVDTSFSALFQVQPRLGRFFTRDEILGDARVATISDTLWRTRFGSDPQIIRKSITIGNDRYAIVGVMPRGFRYPSRTDLWTPLARPVVAETADERDVTVIVRLRPDVSRAVAQSQLDVIATRIRTADSTGNVGLKLILREEMLDRRANQSLPTLSLFLSAAFLVLLVACTNVANLFLARAAERRGEIAIRGALGASRLRLARQVLTEAMLVAAIAAVAGTVLAIWLVQLCLSFIPTQGFPSWLRFDLDERVLGFSIAVAFAATLLVGLTPARQGTRFDLVRALKVGGDAGSGRAGVRRTGARGLVVQLVLAMVLFVGAGLLLQSHRRLMDVDLGYPAERVAVLRTLLDRTRFRDSESQMRFIEELMPRVRVMPGARVVTARGYYFGEPRGAAPATAAKPASGPGDQRVFVDGDTMAALPRSRMRRFVVQEDYFAALDLRVHRGRTFAADDVAGSVPVVVVSKRFAETALWEKEPIGRTIQIGASGQPFTVIGVVSDLRDIQGGRDGMSAEPRADVHFSSRQASGGQYHMLVRTEGDAALMHDAVAGLIRSTEPSAILFRGKTLASQVDEFLLVTRVFGGLIGAFALTALGLALVGLYGLVAYGVAQRTREIGVRLAIGGTSRMVVRMLVGEGLRVVAVGFVVGLALAALATRFLGTLLFGVTPLDAPTYLGAALLFGGVALATCYLASRSASRVHPMTALRSE